MRQLDIPVTIAEYKERRQIQSMLSRGRTQHAGLRLRGTRKHRFLYADNSTVRRTWHSPLASCIVINSEQGDSTIPEVPVGDPGWMVITMTGSLAPLKLPDCLRSKRNIRKRLYGPSRPKFFGVWFRPRSKEDR